MYDYNKELKSVAQKLRKEMTPEEKHLWYDLLKRLPITVRRQFQIKDFIVDFYIASSKTVIEIDGRQHRSRSGLEADAERDRVLAELGITVLRFSNESINNEFTKVAGLILDHLGLSFADLK